MFGNMFLLAVAVFGAVWGALQLAGAGLLYLPLLGLYFVNMVVSNVVFRVHETGRKHWVAYCKVILRARRRACTCVWGAACVIV